MGRQFFRLVKPLANIMTMLLRCLPTPLRKLFWSLNAPFDGPLSLLWRYALLRSLGARLGDNVYIGPYVIIKSAKSLDIGSNVSIHAYSYLDAQGGISIGDNVSIAHACSLVSFEHTWEDTSIPIKYNAVKTAAISIEPDVWIGCGVRILAGTRIGTRSIVAAGAVVNRPADSHSLLAGIPARLVKQI